MQNLAKTNQKALLRKLMRHVLRSEMREEEKLRQSTRVTSYLFKSHQRFVNAKHIALYLAMKQEEIDTIPLIEQLLKMKQSNEIQKSIYVPHVEMAGSSGMVFYELKSLEQYRNEMNTNNKYNLRQFNQTENMERADPSLFDLVIVPGLAFDRVEYSDLKQISRLGRG